MDHYYIDVDHDGSVIRIVRQEEGKMLLEYIDKNDFIWKQVYYAHPRLRDRYVDSLGLEEITASKVSEILSVWK